MEISSEQLANQITSVVNRAMEVMRPHIMDKVEQLVREEVHRAIRLYAEDVLSSEIRNSIRSIILSGLEVSVSFKEPDK